MSFNSKIDLWIALVIGGGFVLCAYSAVDQVRLTRSWASVIPAALFVGVLLLFLPTKYVLGEEQLTVRSGLMHWEIPYRVIEGVAPTHNLLASPALSLDRLRIDYNGGAVMISPKDKERFLAELANRAGLSRSGAQLTRLDQRF